MYLTVTGKIFATDNQNMVFCVRYITDCDWEEAHLYISWRIWVFAAISNFITIEYVILQFF